MSWSSSNHRPLSWCGEKQGALFQPIERGTPGSSNPCIVKRASANTFQALEGRKKRAGRQKGRGDTTSWLGRSRVTGGFRTHTPSRGLQTGRVDQATNRANGGARRLRIFNKRKGVADGCRFGSTGATRLDVAVFWFKCLAQEMAGGVGVEGTRVTLGLQEGGAICREIRALLLSAAPLSVQLALYYARALRVLAFWDEGPFVEFTVWTWTTVLMRERRGLGREQRASGTVVLGSWRRLRECVCVACAPVLACWVSWDAGGLAGEEVNHAGPWAGRRMKTRGRARQCNAMRWPSRGPRRTGSAHPNRLKRHREGCGGPWPSSQLCRLAPPLAVSLVRSRRPAQASVA